MSIYEQGLGRAAVNHVALSPLSFIERAASKSSMTGTPRAKARAKPAAP